MSLIDNYIHGRVITVNTLINSLHRRLQGARQKSPQSWWHRLRLGSCVGMPTDRPIIDALIIFTY
jgi:hypothetical protein